MPPRENLASDEQERGADRTIKELKGGFENVIAFPGANRQKIDSIQKGIGELEKQGIRDPQINAVKQRIERGEVQSIAEVLAAEQIIREIVLKKAENKLKESINDLEDDVLKYTADWMKIIQGCKSIAEMAQELKYMEDAMGDQLKQKRNFEELLAKSPRAAKMYLTEVAKTKDRSATLKRIEKTYARAIKAPESVQGEFFELVEKRKLDGKSYDKVLDKLLAEDAKLKNKYKGDIGENERIFGKKPAKEFIDWIDARKNFDEIRYAQHTLKTRYIPNRQKAQAEFEGMPETVTGPHKDKWENDLGYSERKALLESLHKLEHQSNNPLAQEYMQTLTNSPEEIASKEWSKMIGKFLQHSYEDQDTLMKAYPLTEGRQRKELASRFKALPDDVRQTSENKKFFTLDKEEKITRLTALEKDQAGSDSTEAWQNMMQTESGEEAFRKALGMVTRRTHGQAIVVADILGKKTMEDQRRTGVVSAADRQEANTAEAKGSRIGDKIGLVHDLTDGDVTINETGQKQEFHTIDLDELNQGAMEETSVHAIRRELIEDGTITNDESDPYSMSRFKRRGNNNEIDLSRDTGQRGQLEGMVKQMLMEALMMAVESMGGRPQREMQWNDLSAEQSRAMLSHYQDMTKMQFKGLEGLSTMRKAA